MKNLFLKTLAVGLCLLAIPNVHYGQQFKIAQNETTLHFDITDISNFNERIIFLHNLLSDGRFNVTNSEQDGVFIISVDPAFEGMDLKSTFADFREQNAKAFSKMDKDDSTEIAMEYKSLLSEEMIHSLMMDVYIQSRQNNLCANADPFCTDNGMYQFPAGVNAGYGETGPNYDCLHSTPNPAWYYMRIGTPGNINIYMYSTPSEDIDFCCWGPFDNPVSPCPSGLTIDKRVSCSYSSAATETCQIPSSAQTGQYYILVITNYSNHSCNINFSKNSGNGTTDCGILPPLVENGGPYCVGENIQLTGNAQQGASYTWSGPGGWTANGQSVTRPNCTLAMNGTYTCTINLNGQTNSATTEVHVYANPTANFTATSVCKGESTQFTNSSTTNPANQTMTYLWDFGDGQTSNQQNPTHQFATAGNYTVTLTASCGGDACTSTKTQTITVYETPVANAGEDQTVQYGATAQLQGSGGTGTFNYHWEPADKVVNPNSQNTQTIGMTESTTFTLTVTHPQGGCSSTDQVSVLVSGSNMTATASASPTTICLGETSQLQATGIGGTGNFTYTWTPTIGLSAPNIANPVAHPTETTTYTCLVDDGLSNQVVSTTITVNYPEYEEETQYICPSESYNFYGQDYSEEGDYDYVTTTAQGCEKVITLHLHHYPSYPNAHVTTAYICPGTSYQFHGDYYYVDGTYQKNLRTVHGCDSIVWLNLTVYPQNDTIIVDPKICTTQTYNFHGTEYSNDGDVAYFDTIDSHGCLLVEKLVLTVGDYQMPPVQHEYVCYAHDDTPYFYWDKTGRHYTQDIQTDTILPDPNGECDIKYRLDLRFHQEYYQTDTLTVCDSYDWPIDPLNPYTSTNHHIVKTFTTGGGANFNCDSTYVLDLTVNYSHPKTIDTVACNEYFWECVWNHEFDTLLTESGTYHRLIETALGCDSLITLNVQFDYSPIFPRVEGHSWVVGGSEFQYTIEDYWIETPGTHTTEWKLKYWGGPHDGEDFDKWDLIPYGDSYDRCLVYIYTYELDTIALYASTTSTGFGNTICGDSYQKSKLIICTPYGIAENETLCSVDIYPNPNNGDMTLSFSNMEGLTSVKVFDMQGTLVDHFQVNNGFGTSTHRYSTSHLKAGVYFFSMTGQRGMVNKKVIIMK